MSQLGRAVPPGPMTAPPPAIRPVRADPIAAVLLLIAGALVFNYVVTIENIPRTISAIQPPLSPLRKTTSPGA